MIRRILSAALVLLPVFAQAQVKLLRHPTYSKGKIAFSYLGDIWISSEAGNDAHRLTVNKARDQFPRFSPDGQWVAFSSNREGNYDVYIVAAAGGEPRQLTFNSADDNVVGWSHDGKKVIFSSTRGNGAFPSVATLWEVPVDGGIERAVNTDWGAWASYSPDGTKLAFSRHPSVWSRKHYRGSYAADLWVEDLASKKFTKLGDPDYAGNLLWPMYGNNGEIFFVSNELPNEKGVKPGSAEVMKSSNNIWKISDKGGKAVQVTHHTDGNLFFPSISADAKVIVYEDNFGLWKLDTATGKSTEIRIDIKSDLQENKTELVTLSNLADGFSISPSNRRAAVSVHGEIFTVATDRGQIQRVTETPWKEHSPHWSPDGKWIAFVSDRTGREEIYISDELGKTTKKLTDADCDKVAIVWASDSKSFLWTGSDHKLRRTDIDGKEETLVSNPGGNISDPQFSPDGKWISYSQPDQLLRSHVYLKELATGKETVITSDRFMTSRGARWTPDGKKLLLIGGQGGGAGIASTGGRGSSGLYVLSLTPIEKDPTDRDIDTEAQAEAAAENAPAGRGGRGAGAPPANAPVKIVWEGMDRRFTQMAATMGNINMILPSPDGHTYLFSAAGAGAAGAPDPAAAFAGGGMYTMSEDGSNVTRLNTTVTDSTPGRGGRGGRGGGFGGGGEPQWARDSRSIYFMQGGGLFNLAVGGGQAGGTAAAPAAAAAAGGRGGRGNRGGGGAGAGAATETAAAGPSPRRIDVTVRMEIDIPAERQQVFEEAWRVMRNRFYDPKMHGANWTAAKDTYESLLPYISDTEELHNVIMEMIGDINASHTGISGGSRVPGQAAQEERVQTRYPGFDIEPDDSGFYKVSFIYRGGPADHDFVKLSVGDYVLALNDKPLKTSENYWKLFNILPGRKFEFMVNSKPSTDGAWMVSLEPLSAMAQSNLAYDRWVAERKAMVSQISGGKIGYLHIKAMDAPSLAKFQLDLLENQDKQGLIIDERFNGGGGIDQELLEILNQRKVYQTTRNRDSLEVKRPGQAYFGAMVVLQNERSASDAEMFPAGFRFLGLGKVIGVPTMGAVIGTGSFTLLDGSALRTPGSGVFIPGSDAINMENYGVPPDILVDNGPSDFLSHHDRQIEKAVEVLNGQMK